MRTSAKVGLVIAGYVAAVLVAWGGVAIYVAATAGPDRVASGGMYAFGDSLLFLAIFGVAAVPPTGAALFFLRPYPSFWRVLAVAATFVAITGVSAVIVFFAAQGAGASRTVQYWSMYAILRILVAPLFALAFLVGGVMSPHRRARIALGAATLSEAAVFVCTVALWILQTRH
jgi:hypothetical protein